MTEYPEGLIKGTGMSEVERAQAALKATDAKLRAVYLSEENEHLLYGALHEVLQLISAGLADATAGDLGDPSEYMVFTTLVEIQEKIAKELG